MKKAFSSALAYLVGLTLIAGPVLIAMFLADRLSVHIEAGKAQILADDVVRRSEETGEQGRAAAEALAANRAKVACSPEEIALMRQLAISSSYLQGVGRVRANRLICSSLGNHGAGFDLGPPDSITDRGIKIWVAATLPVAPQSRFLISEVQGYAAIVHGGHQQRGAAHNSNGEIVGSCDDRRGGGDRGAGGVFAEASGAFRTRILVCKADVTSGFHALYAS